jgi:geranylgeranyl reductase family protein
MPEEYDVAIVGAGPGGSTAASFLSRAGVHALLVDKANFPRDKSCGDAVCGRSVDILRELGLDPPPLGVGFMRPVGQIFYNLRGDRLEIPFASPDRARSNGDLRRKPNGDSRGPGRRDPAEGSTRAYVIPRMLFDDMLFQHARRQPYVTALDGMGFTDVFRENGRIAGIVATDAAHQERRFRARIVIGADGALSRVAEVLGAYDFRKRRHEHWIGAFRTYYRDISGLGDRIEIHFLEDLVPGYLWIFPIGDGLANVGAGMVESLLVGNNGAPKVNLKKTAYRLLASHPRFSARFRGAKEVEGSFKGWQLPCGSERRTIAGDGWMLIGDAASLIDPFNGEGIHNAMLSAKLAADQAAIGLRNGAVHDGGLAPYQTAVWNELGAGFASAYRLQKMLSHPASRWLLDTLVHRASKRPRLRDALVDLMEHGQLDRLSKPLTYARLLLH